VNNTVGGITIQFVPVTAEPTLSALSIVSGSAPVSVSVGPPTVTLTQSQQQQFTATVTGSANTSVTWSLAPPTGASSISTAGLYTAPASIAATQTVTVIATSVADNTKTGTATVTLNPPGLFTPIYINSGGPAYTDPTGTVWSADTGRTAANIYGVGNPIANTTTQPLYQSEAWNGTPFQYQFTVPNGSYLVTLKFAEIFFTAPNQRVFNVVINGVTTLPNFDVFAAAGAAFTAVDRQFTANVTNGQLTIQFTPVINNPKISALSITAAPAGITVGVTPPTATLTQSQTQQFTATVTGSANTAVTWSLTPPTGAGSISTAGLYTAPASITTTQTVTVTATSAADNTKKGTATVTLNPPSGSFTPIYINSGGPAYTDPTGIVWSADTGRTAANSYAVSNSIANTTTQPLYQSEAWNGAPFQYQFTVPNGSYLVTLKFAEIFFTAPNQRVFNVVINGVTALSNFDIFATAGAAFTALDRQFTANVTNGQLTIQLTQVINNPKISALSITAAPAGITVGVTPPTATLTQGQTQQFSATVTGTANTAVTWSLTPPTGAGTISAGGLYTAPSSITTTQSVTVTATSAADNTKTGTAAVTLNPSGLFTPIYINSGGLAYTDSSGIQWSADTGRSAANSYSVGNPIANTSAQTLYQSEAWNDTAFQYQFVVPNGTYVVTLKFAEIYFTAPNQRVFTVVANGVTKLANFDVFAAAGGAFTAVDRQFTVNVTNGQITIQLVPNIAQPKVNALSITLQ